MMYLSENELQPAYPKATEFDAFAQFYQHADVLIHDAQYLERDLPQKHGWGHSLVSQACELAVAAEVSHLILGRRRSRCASPSSCPGFCKGIAATGLSSAPRFIGPSN